MYDSTAGGNSFSYARSSCAAAGHLNNRLKAWSKFLRKSNKSLKKASRGTRFAITTSSLDFAGWVGRGLDTVGKCPLQPNLLIRSMRSRCQETFELFSKM